MHQASVLEPQLFGTVVESLLLGAAQAERESRVQLALFGKLSSQRHNFLFSAERDLLGEWMLMGFNDECFFFKH